MLRGFTEYGILFNVVVFFLKYRKLIANKTVEFDHWITLIISHVLTEIFANVRMMLKIIDHTVRLKYRGSGECLFLSNVCCAKHHKLMSHCLVRSRMINNKIKLGKMLFSDPVVVTWNLGSHKSVLKYFPAWSWKGTYVIRYYMRRSKSSISVNWCSCPMFNLKGFILVKLQPNVHCL